LDFSRGFWSYSIPISDEILSFHMPFFFLSGALLKLNFSKFMKIKARYIFIPFLIFWDNKFDYKNYIFNLTLYEFSFNNFLNPTNVTLWFFSVLLFCFNARDILWKIKIISYAFHVGNT
jgi:hypothetical protein